MASVSVRMPRAVFAEVSAHGRTYGGARLSLRTKRLPRGQKSVCTVVVPKKVAARAAARNLLKRRGREALRRCLIAKQHPYAAALYFKEGAAALSFSELSSEVARLCRRLS